MGIKLPVPEPSERDFTFERTGYEVWYEHDSEASASGKIEDWKQEVLSAIRLANYHKKRAEALSELLSLRTGEGDEEVSSLEDEILHGIGTDYFGDKKGCEDARQALSSLVDIAISLRRQNAEAKRREQIMAHHCQKYVEMTWEQAEAAYDAAEPAEISREEIDRIVGLVLAMNDEELEEKDLRQQLRAAQAEVERLQKQELETVQVIINHRNFIADQKKQIDALQSQLAAMQAASVEEVDALVKRWPKSNFHEQAEVFHASINLARTFARQRDEIVGLLKFIDMEITGFMPLVKRLAEMSTEDHIREACKRILEIVAASDGKSESEVGR